MATLSTASKLQYEFMIGGGPPHLMALTAQTDTTGYLKGMPMLIDASGEWAGCATGQIGPAENSVIGIALHDYPGASETQTCVFVTDHTVFSAVVAHATTASAITGTTMLGNVYAIESCASIEGAATSACFLMGIASTDTQGGYVMGFKDDVGTAYGRVYFVFSRAGSTESPFWTGIST